MEKNEELSAFFPIAYDVEEGKTYKWCGCGETNSPPFCDKANCGKMHLYRAELTETVYFCHCKETKDPPLCDGSHGKLLRDYLNKRKT